MQRLSPYILTLLLSLGTFSALNAAQNDLPGRLHPWGQFKPGAWKKVRVTTEVLNEQGEVIDTCVTDTRTTLLEIDKQGVTLEVETCVEVAGKPFERGPQTDKQGFYGELVSQNVTIKDPTDGLVVIDEQKIPCKLQQIESAGPNGKTVNTIYYSTTIPPYVFKRESVVTDPEGKTVNETTMEVVALQMPCQVLDELRSKGGFHVKTVQKNAKGTVFTWAVNSLEVPGGVVSLYSKELDKNGRMVRRSTLKLIDYDLDSDKDRNLFKNRRDMRRRAKSAAH